MDSCDVADLLTVEEFERLLSTAESEASRDGEITFVAETRERFDKYQGRMFISGPQLAWLRCIAKEQ